MLLTIYVRAATSIDKLLRKTMKIKIFGFFLSLMFSANAFADLFVSAGYKHISDETVIGMNRTSVSLNSIYFSAGYHYNYSANISIVPQIGFAQGMEDENVDTFFAGGDILVREQISLDQILDFSLSLQYQATERLYGIATILYSKADYDAEVTEQSFSDSGVGFGAGVGLSLTEKFSVLLTADVVNDRDSINLGLRYTF